MLLRVITMTLRYDGSEPTRAAVDDIRGPVVVEFGADWCGHCQAAQPLIAAALSGHPDVQHLKIADGKGRPLGRSFGVKLWPTLVFLRDGQEVTRVIRPTDVRTVQQGLDSITEPASPAEATR